MKKLFISKKTLHAEAPSTTRPHIPQWLRLIQAVTEGKEPAVEHEIEPDGQEGLRPKAYSALPLPLRC